MIAPVSTETSARCGCVREIVCGLRHDLYSRFSVAMLKAFIDDSGSGGDSPWYVLAGYLGTVEGWDAFDSKWLDVLHEHPYIEYFKSSEAESLRPDGQWAGVSKEQRDAKIDALIGVIGHCTRRAVCAPIRQRDYDELVKGKIPPVWDSPYFFLMPSIISASINIERIDGESESVDFVFDNDQKHEKGSNRLNAALMLMRSNYGSLVNVSFRDEKKFIPLQAADLLAWQIRRRYSVPNDRRRHFEKALDAPQKEAHTFVVDRDKVQWMIAELQKGAAELAESLDRSPDLTTW
jgi:hypothetical protein